MSLKPRSNVWLALFAMPLLLGSPTQLLAQKVGVACPPSTRLDNVEDKYGKTVVVDPYRWLEDQDSKESRAWIEAQAKCTETALRKLPGREAITKRLTELYRIDTYGLPEEHGGRYFFHQAIGRPGSDPYLHAA